jgi:hypothetical protein
MPDASRHGHALSLGEEMGYRGVTKLLQSIDIFGTLAFESCIVDSEKPKCD